MLVSVGRGWGELLHEYPWDAHWGADKKDRLPARSGGILLWVTTAINAHHCSKVALWICSLDSVDIDVVDTVCYFVYYK